MPGLWHRHRYPNSKGGYDVRDEGHEGWSTEDFLNHPLAQAAGLTAAEVVGLRLYTGPGYVPINRSLRCGSDRFPATEWAIDAAVGKLAAGEQNQDLLRGLHMLPAVAWVEVCACPPRALLGVSCASIVCSACAFSGCLLHGLCV